MTQAPKMFTKATSKALTFSAKSYLLQALILFMISIVAFFSVVSPAKAQTVQFSKFNAQSKQVVDHSQWSILLSRYVKPQASGLNLVDYQDFKLKGSKALTAYLLTLQKLPISGYNRNEQFAFWANLYNAKTIDIIISHYPVATIKDIDISGLFSNGPWGKKVVTIEGVPLSLNDIEHKILRPIWKDPRVHYAVNCASIGCPNLGVTAFTGSKLSAMLNQAASDYINSARGVSVGKNGRVTASKIFNWYGRDFGGTDQSLLAHFRQYAKPDLKAKLKNAHSIYSYIYNWNLNEPK